MVDLSAVAGLATSLKVAGDITKAMIGLRDAQMIQSKVIELQSVILAAQGNAMATQSEHFSLIERVRELETEISGLKRWEAEKQRYELVQAGGTGTVAYRIKESVQGSEPLHHICARCYEDGHKSILQQETRFPGRVVVWVCPRCKADIFVNGARTMA